MAGFSYRGREPQTEKQTFTYRRQTTQKRQGRGGSSTKKGEKDTRAHFSQRQKINFNSVLLLILVIDMQN